MIEQNNNKYTMSKLALTFLFLLSFCYFNHLLNNNENNFGASFDWDTGELACRRPPFVTSLPVNIVFYIACLFYFSNTT